MHFDSIEDLHRAIDDGAVGEGDVIFMSPGVYSSLTASAQAALWDRVLGARVVLVTGLPMVFGIEIMPAREVRALRDRGFDATA